MELTIERAELVRDCRYAQNMQEQSSYIIRESGGMDNNLAVVLLRNLGEKKDITSLEREALATAIRVLRQNMETQKQ